MTCPNCGGDDHLTCKFCQYRHFPEPDADGVSVLGETASEQCPACDRPLVHAVIRKGSILYCENCRGMLLPVDLFVLLVNEFAVRPQTPAATPHRASPSELDRRIRCPKCLADMDTHWYAGPGNIVIDNCPRCELNWLDHAELARIVGTPG